ncbi:hypothetical protein ACWEPM_24545 [Streptomyces sp. NPDC004244]
MVPSDLRSYASATGSGHGRNARRWAGGTPVPPDGVADPHVVVPWGRCPRPRDDDLDVDPVHRRRARSRDLEQYRQKKAQIREDNDIPAEDGVMFVEVTVPDATQPTWLPSTPSPPTSTAAALRARLLGCLEG